MSTVKLNQIIAIEKGTKSRSHSELTEAHHALQKPALLQGIARKYSPKDEEGDKLPSEETRVQVTVEEMLDKTTEILSKKFDVTATKDWGNTKAVGDVVVDGVTLLAQVPVTYLLFLEKELVDIHTFVKKLPVLDPSEHWEFSNATNNFVTPASETVKTKKVMRNHVKAPATDKHPAQVDVFSEDVLVGTWSTVKASGALPQARATELLRRVEKLQNAVKFAREAANNTDVSQQHVGNKVFGFLFAK